MKEGYAVFYVGYGVASFGAYLLSSDIIAISLAPNDGHQNQIMRSFAAAPKDKDVWVMNVVSEDGSNTLKLIYAGMQIKLLKYAEHVTLIKQFT